MRWKHKRRLMIAIVRSDLTDRLCYPTILRGPDLVRKMDASTQLTLLVCPGSIPLYLRDMERFERQRLHMVRVACKRYERYARRQDLRNKS